MPFYLTIIRSETWKIFKPMKIKLAQGKEPPSPFSSGLPCFSFHCCYFVFSLCQTFEKSIELEDNLEYLESMLSEQCCSAGQGLEMLAHLKKVVNNISTSQTMSFSSSIDTHHLHHSPYQSFLLLQINWTLSELSDIL